MSEAIHIGELRTQLTLEAPSRTSDDGGGAAVTWTEIAVLWARVTPRTGGESYDLDRVAGKVSHEIVVRHRGDVSPDMRLRDGARIYDIRAAFDPDSRRQWLKCLAEERDL